MGGAGLACRPWALQESHPSTTRPPHCANDGGRREAAHDWPRQLSETAEPLHCPRAYTGAAGYRARSWRTRTTALPAPRYRGPRFSISRTLATDVGIPTPTSIRPDISGSGRFLLRL